MKFTVNKVLSLILSLSSPLLISHEGAGLAEAGYYEGKTIKIVEGRRPGGTGSLRTTITVKHLKKYLGFSAAVFQYMPGGGGMGAGNHVATAARRDGVAIGNRSGERVNRKSGNDLRCRPLL